MTRKRLEQGYANYKELCQKMQSVIDVFPRADGILTDEKKVEERKEEIKNIR